MCGNTEYLIYYVYDETGLPIGLKYRTSAYEAGVFDCFFFEKNLQGDIIGVYNSTGKRIGTYTYDAWGNFNYSFASGNTALENRIVFRLNPFRYRGYYYDVETGYYYLQSRYYNPEWGRFLNADGYVSTGAGMLGYNMFVYANNNPVMFVDPTGEAWWHWALAAAVVVACAAATVATCGMSLGGAAMAISMVASGSAALTTASTVAAAATIGSSIALAGMAIDAAINSSSADEFANHGNMSTVFITGGGGIIGAGYGYITGRNINKSIFPTDKTRINHIFSDKEGHVADTPKNRELLTKLSVPKNYVGTDGWGNQWYSKILKDGRQAWSESRNGIVWDGGINSSPLPWDPNTGYKRP